jgi:phosphoglycolate phosphatase
VVHPYGFIFDLDGTLVDSLQDITNALNAALHALHRAPADASMVRSWVGDGMQTLCRRAVPDDSPATVAALVQATSEHYRQHCADHTRPYPKVLKMLDLLRARHAPMGVLSNKPHGFTVQLVKALGLDGYFAEVRGSTSEEDRKPSPQNASAIAVALGVAPEQIFLVGDSPMDVETARQAGMVAVAVTWGFRDRAELEACHPDFFIDDPQEIPDLPEKAPKGS